MTKCYLAIIVSGLILTTDTSVSSQTISWAAPISVAANTYKNQHPRITLASNGNPVVLWGDGATNNGYVSRWTGSAFATPLRINPAGTPVFSSSWAGPDLASKGDTVYVVYKGEPEDTSGIYLRRSTNGGMSFGMPARVDNILGYVSRFPSVSVDASGQPVVSFMKFNSGFTAGGWVVSRSMDWGNTFMAEVTASGYTSGEPVCDCCPGTLAVSGNNMVMLYRNNLSDKRTMWAGISKNGGTSLPTGMEIDNTNWMVNACPGSGPDGVIVGDTVYAAYMSGAGGAKVYYSKSSISTGQGGVAIPLTGGSTGITGQNYPRVASDGNTVVMVWPQIENAEPQIAIRFTGNIQNGLPAWGKAAVGSPGNPLMNPDVAIKNGVIHLVWEDMATGTVRYQRGTYSLTGVNTVASKNDIIVAPVPAHDILQLSLAKPERRACVLTITDMASRVILKYEYTAIDQPIQIETSALVDGIYQLQLKTDNGLLWKQFTVKH